MALTGATKKMNVWQLTMLVAANMLGAGIIMLPTKLAQVGTVSVFSWLVTALGSLALAQVFAQCGMFSRHCGGMGGYAAYRFGLPGYYMTNFSYAVSLIIANVAIAVSAVGYGATLFGQVLTPLQVSLATIAVLWLTGTLNFGGNRRTGRISSVTVWGSLLPVFFIGTVGIFWFDPALYRAAWNPQELPFFAAVGESITLTLWAFLGFESAAANMAVIENPQRDVPRATFFGTLGVAVLYIAATNIMAGIVPNADLLRSDAPFGLAFAQMFGPTVGSAVMGIMVISCVGALLCWQFTLSQVFKSSAETGIFPKIFARISQRGVPTRGILILLGVQSVLALMTMDEYLLVQFERLVDLAVVTNIVPYLYCMLAAPAVLQQEGASRKRVLTVGMVAAAGFFYSLYAVYTAGVEANIGAVAVLFIGYLLFETTIRRHPEQVQYRLQYEAI
ncbi:MAG: putrescine-ornithine antiporter [Veillonellaceae bacterium]|nr:putrescine-ornithine antiporter [Veillonellaceae bacterium]